MILKVSERILSVNLKSREMKLNNRLLIKKVQIRVELKNRENPTRLMLKQ